MQRKNLLRLLLLVNILVIVSLSCALTDAFDTAEDLKEGVETMQSIVTEIDESGIKETGQAIATQVDESGIKETAQAAITDVAVEPGEIPDDIPVMEGNTNLLASGNEITYSISEDFQVVVDYYKSQMPALGWTEAEPANQLGDNIAELSYQKGDRNVDIIITDIIIMVQVVISQK
jgi:hypothetical protein